MYVKFRDEGYEAIQGWKILRNTNIFEKDYVFIPINGCLHWSLCVVVNAGSLVKQNSPEELTENKSFLLFFDPVKNCHNTTEIANNVRMLLNEEVKRQYNHIDQNIFTNENLQEVCPQGVFYSQYNSQ